MQEKFARWHILFFQYLKRDWQKIIVWVLGLGIFAAGFLPAFKEIAKGDGVIGMYETLQNPAMISMVGPTPIKIASQYTLGAMYAHEMLLFCSLFAMTISILHVIGHTRKEEDLGLTELVRSFQVGRQANSLAVLLETIVINLLLALLIGGVMTGYGLDTISAEGSFLFGLSVGIAGIIGGVIALVMAQIMPASSGATGFALGIMGLMYIIRGGTDIWQVKLSMLIPLGWSYLTYPFTENNWLPILLGLAFSFVMAVVAFILEGARDMGAGYLPEGEGRENARKSLLSVPGLFLKLNQGIIISWLFTFLILGVAYGTIYGDMGTFIEGNEILQQMFSHSGFTIEESFTSTIMMVMVGLVAILPIAVVNKLFAQERNLYLSQIYGTKVKRCQFYWTSIILAVIMSIVGICLSAGGLGFTALSAMKDDAMQTLDFFAAGFNLLPSVLFFLSLAALALGWVPRLGRAIYVYLVYSFLLNYFESLLDLPKWFIKTAPQSWLPKVPMEEFSLISFVLVTLISILLTLIGSFGYQRRDMVERA